MFKTLTTTAIAIVMATSAQAASFGTEVGGDATQIAVAINSNNVAIGENARAYQAANVACGVKTGGDLTQIAVAINSNNVAIGRGAHAVQASNLMGDSRCISR